VEEMMSSDRRAILPFNTPLETGIRSIGILVAAYPRAFDLQRLVAFDHLVVHTGDIGGPTSLHPALPMRSTELLVRRGIVERGLLLMMSRRLVDREPTSNGIFYRAGEMAETFITSLTSPYLVALRDRASWVAEAFSDMQQDTFREMLRAAFGRWMEEFQSVERSLASHHD
jgi:hypothetical protein